MKTQITKPAERHEHYSADYKQQALELWRASGRSAAKVAAELGIRPALIFRWSKQQRDKAQGQTARGARSLAEVEAENRHLREENAKLLEQREVLKKSLGILSEPPPRGMPGSNR